MLPVLIVGAGPVGLLQALLLAKHDVPVILLERHDAPLTLPKAHVISSRSLEIFRQAGVSIPAIRAFPTKREEARRVRFVTTLSGTEVGVVPFDDLSVGVLDISPEVSTVTEGTGSVGEGHKFTRKAAWSARQTEHRANGPGVGVKGRYFNGVEIGPAPILHNIAQPDLQGLLELQIHPDGKVKIQRGWTWLSCTETDDGVTSTVQNTYTDEIRIIHSSVIIACDGTNSRIRQAAGIELEEEDGPQMMSLHFSADLHPVVKDRVGMLHWIMDPAVQGVIIAYDLSGNQVLLHQYDPSTHSAESFTPDRCREIIRTALGCDIPFTYLNRAPWRMKSQVAKRFSKGRIVLAGDAAHSFPPTGGLGLNSGIADAQNLAWRLSTALSPTSPSSSSLSQALHAYTSERRPVALRNAARAMLYGGKVFDLLKTLGLTDPDVTKARTEMHTRLEDPAWQGRIEEMIEEQREQFHNTNLHMGYTYTPTWHFSSGSHFSPSYIPGARLSHAWIAPSRSLLSTFCPLVHPVDLSYLSADPALPSEAMQNWKYSTLDIVPLGRAYVLFCKAGTDDVDIWNRLKLGMSERGTALRVIVADRDFEWVDQDKGNEWERAYGLNKGRGVLVRPDQYVQAILDGSENANEIIKMLGVSLVEASASPDDVE